MKSQSEQNKEINVFFLRKELDWEKKKNNTVKFTILEFTEHSCKQNKIVK